jgi:lysophospholipase L1-like esterase
VASKPRKIDPGDGRLSWEGPVSLERGDGYVAPWRLPFPERGLFHPEVVTKAADPAGARIRFRSDTTSLSGRIDPVAEMCPLDLVSGGEVAGSVEMDGRERFGFGGLPGGEKLVELWLPQWGPFRLRELAIDAGASLSPAPDDAPRWIAYGSSITQCRTAASPTATWPAIVAREAGLNLVCLGFGGQCHLEPMVARLVRDLGPDFVSICAGINIYGGASLGPRSFREALVGTVRTIREKRPVIPITLQSPIYGCARETTPNAVGFTLPAMREEVRAAVEVLRDHGDANVHYVDGLEILGEADASLLPDELHPDPDGYRLMGRNFLEKVARRLFARDS